jgi:hypothetical protein
MLEAWGLILEQWRAIEDFHQRELSSGQLWLLNEQEVH